MGYLGLGNNRHTFGDSSSSVTNADAIGHCSDSSRHCGGFDWPHNDEIAQGTQGLCAAKKDVVIEDTIQPQK